jgi:hypothetical protein
MAEKLSSRINNAGLRYNILRLEKRAIAVAFSQRAALRKKTFSTESVVVASSSVRVDDFHRLAL